MKIEGERRRILEMEWMKDELKEIDGRYRYIEEEGEDYDDV